MKIKTLIENTPVSSAFTAEHGLSLYIETGNHKILYDMGQTSLFTVHAEKMQVSLAKVDMAVLSHGHYDHGGGLPTFLEVNKTAPVYIRKEAFGDYYSRPDKYIGLDKSLQESDRLVYTEDFTELNDGITLATCNGKKCKYPMSQGLLVKENDNFFSDPFLHEQYLMIEENGRKILFSACSHKGVLNIMDWFHPDIFIGGFHYKNLDAENDRKFLLEQAKQLMKYHTRYYTCHCTGISQYEVLHSVMGDKLSYLYCGQEIRI